MRNESMDGNMQKRQQTIKNDGTIVTGGVINISGDNAQLGAKTTIKNINKAHRAASKSPPITPNQSQTTPFEAFFSYAEEDQKYVKGLQDQLIQLKREKVITDWHGSKLAAGSDRTESVRHFNQASVLLLLISPDYIASDHRYEEVKRARERRDNEGIKVIPILVRPVNLVGTPISDLQPIPRKGKTISEYRKLDDAFYEVATEIREVIEAVKKERGSS